MHHPHFVGWVFPIFFASIVSLALLSSWLKAKRRRDALEQAARMGFTPVIDAGWASVYSLPHPLFNRGHAKQVDWAIEGSAGGLRARLLDYQYTVGSGKSSSTLVQTVAAFQMARPMPAFHMYPEHFYHKIADLFGYQDIDFAGFDAFSDNYRLLGPDEPAIRGLFTPPLLSAMGQALGWTVEGDGVTLLVYRPSEQAPIDGLPGFLARAREVAEAFTLR